MLINLIIIIIINIKWKLKSNNLRKNREIFINISAPDASNLDFKQDLLTLDEIKVYIGIRMLFCINRKHNYIGINFL